MSFSVTPHTPLPRLPSSHYLLLVPFMKGGWAFSTQGKSRQDILNFATAAVALLRARCPYCLATFFMRVDVMQRDDGQLLVNEFESFEAAASGPVAHEEATDRYLTEFWLHQLSSVLN
jgi:hypothetical protein